MAQQSYRDRHSNSKISKERHSSAKEQKRAHLQGILSISPINTLKQMTGIEPASPAWEAGVLPMNYICMYIIIAVFSKKSRAAKKQKGQLRNVKKNTKRNTRQGSCQVFRGEYK